jgi:outer membrane immunogenic protein
VGTDWELGGDGAVKKILLGATVYFAATMTAFAADMAVRPYPAAPIAAPVVFSWTGCYVGVEGGGNWGTSGQVARSGANAGAGITGSYALSGGIAGGTIGCNYQVNNFILGIENDYSWTNKNGFVHDLPPFNIVATSGTREKWIDTLRGRLGYAIDPYLMVYGTAGAAFAGTEVDVLSPLVGSVANSKSRVGWTAGVGGEWAAFAGPWGALTFKLEYLHAGFGTAQYINPPVTVGGGTVVTRDVSLSDDMVRVGMNVKWNWGGPVVAKY